MKLFFVDVSKLKPNPDNLFPPLPPAEYEDLKGSVARHGIQEPLIVIPENGTGSYLIQAGHHRWRAATELSIGLVPCIESTHDKVDAIIETEIYRRMLTKEDRLKYKAKAAKVRGDSVRAFTDAHLLPEIKALEKSGKITETMAIQLALLPHENQQAVLDMMKPAEIIEVIDPDNKFLKAEQDKHQKELADARAETMKAMDEAKKDALKAADLIKTKEADNKTLRDQQEKARIALQDLLEEKESFKKKSTEDMSDELRKEFDKAIAEARKQLDTYKTAALANAAEIEVYKDKEIQTKQQLKDLQCEANAQWVAANNWKDSFRDEMKKAFSPMVITSHITAATNAVVATDQMLRSFRFDPAIRLAAKAALGRLHEQITEIINMQDGLIETLSPLDLPAPVPRIEHAA